jgi:hypothetical protein
VIQAVKPCPQKDDILSCRRLVRAAAETHRNPEEAEAVSKAPGSTSTPDRTHELVPRQGGGLADAEAARNRATCRLRDAEHWRRLVEARLDLAVAAVADIDDLEVTLLELRDLIGMPDSDGDGRLAESSLLIRLRAALGELDAYIAAAKGDVDDATERVAVSLVSVGPPSTYTH